MNPKSEIVNPTLSLCMIVKNEEKLLPGCLESVKDYVDEIIIVDTGSTDRTVEIAKKYKAKIYHHPWENSFSKARNYSLKYATCDWILWLDADEEIDKKDACKLRDVIKDNNVRVIYLPLFSKSNQGTNLSVANMPKIFRNHRGFHFKGIVHNALIYSGNIKKVNIKGTHHGYDYDDKQMEKKFIRTSTLLKKQIASNPEDPKPHQYLATSYLERKKYDECISEALKAIELYERFDERSPFLLLTYYTLSVAYRNKNELESAEECALKAIRLNPDHIDHYDILSIVYFLRKDYAKFFNHTQKYFKLLRLINEDPSSVTEIPYNTLNNAWLAYSRISIVYYEQGKEEDGKQALRDAIECTDNAWEPYFVIGKYFFKQGNFEAAERYLSDGLKYAPHNKDILYYLAETCESSGSIDKALTHFKKITECYPDEIIAQYRLGLLRAKHNQYEKAISSFKTVISRNGQHIGALFNLGIMYERVGDVVRAKETYNKVLTLKPEYSEVLVRLGSMYLNEYDYFKAKECFVHTLRQGKYLLESHLAMSKIYVLLDDLESCVVSCNELLKHLGLPRNITIESLSDLVNLYNSIGTTLLKQQRNLLANCSFGIADLLGEESFNEDAGIAQVPQK